VHLPLTTRFFLGEAKKQHKARFIDRYLARIPAKLTEVELGFVQKWLQNDGKTKQSYQAHNHIAIFIKGCHTNASQATIKGLVNALPIPYLWCRHQNCEY